jgi:hypothetical protein
MNMNQPLLVQVTLPSTATSSTFVDSPVFVCPQGAEYEIIEISEVHSVLGTDGSAVTADFKKCAVATAPASGTTVLLTTFNLKSTINTPVVKTPGNGGMVLALASRTLTAGQMLSLDLTGTLTALAGVRFDIWLKNRRKNTNR